MSARDRVLGDVRRALNRADPPPRSVVRGLEERLARPPVNTQPALAGDLVALFVARCAAVKGIVSQVPDRGAVSAVVARHLADHGLGAELVMAPDSELDEVPWSNRLLVERRAARGTDRVSVTGGFAGVAETGSVVLLSSPESPTTLNFLPDDHLVILRAERIVAYTEDVWVRVRGRGEPLPRTVNFITGPSKTGDVEQVIQEGAHGPRRVHIIIVAGW